MSYSLGEVSSSVFSGTDPERTARARTFIEQLNEHGLKVRLTADGVARIADDVSEVTEALGGAETSNNLTLLVRQINNMRNLATWTSRDWFRSTVTQYVQASNRSVDSNLRNLDVGVRAMLQFLMAFVGKEVKNPLRYLELGSSAIDYGQDPELIYSEEETGTAHTLQVLGDNQAWYTWSTYLEDTPSVRRYIRYVDSIAARWGMRLVYCPKEFNHPEELGTPAQPNWTREGNRIVRTIHADRFKVLHVTFTFIYQMFRDLTVIETDVQPGQRPRQANQMEYSPIFVDNLDAIVRVLTTLGAFPACKIYYKDYQNSARSSQAAPSS